MNSSNYRNNFKTTLAFGGMQIISVIVSVLRGKMVAVLLGPAGMGVNYLYLNAINLISTFSGFGLELSGVREISESSSDKSEKLGKDITILRKTFLVTGVLGTLLTVVLAPTLSYWTFGNRTHTFHFILLALFILLTSVYKYQQTVLRGLREIPFILKSGIVGAVIGLILSFPVYYFLGMEGIVYGILIGVFSNYAASHYYYRKIKRVKVQVSNKEFIEKGKSLVGLGMMLVIAVLIGLGAKYIISIYIGKIGDIKDVGYYTAAIGISSQYIGFILSSLSADYFPRIAAVHADPEKLNAVVNEQIEIVLLLATPLLILMLISSPLIVKIFLSKDFLVIKDFIRFIALGSFFQMASYCQGYISFAKNDKKTFLLMEGLFSNILQVVVTLISYKIWGLQGLGIAFLAIYFIYFITVNTAVVKLYKFHNSREILRIFLTMSFFITAVFVSFLILDESPSAYALSGVLFLGNLTYCYHQINKKINIKSILLSKFNK